MTHLPVLVVSLFDAPIPTSDSNFYEAGLTWTHLKGNAKIVKDETVPITNMQ